MVMSDQVSCKVLCHADKLFNLLVHKAYELFLAQFGIRQLCTSGI